MNIRKIIFPSKFITEETLFEKYGYNRKQLIDRHDCMLYTEEEQELFPTNDSNKEKLKFEKFRMEYCILLNNFLFSQTTSHTIRDGKSVEEITKKSIITRNKITHEDEKISNLNTDLFELAIMLENEFKLNSLINILLDEPYIDLFDDTEISNEQRYNLLEKIILGTLDIYISDKNVIAKIIINNTKLNDCNVLENEITLSDLKKIHTRILNRENYVDILISEYPDKKIYVRQLKDKGLGTYDFINASFHKEQFQAFPCNHNPYWTKEVTDEYFIREITKLDEDMQFLIWNHLRLHINSYL